MGILKDKELEFKVRKIVCQAALDHALNVDPDRVDISVLDNVVRATFRIATLDEAVFDYPENFLTRWATKWQRFKGQRFPKWLIKRYPIVTNRVWAISKFPELNLPREFQSAEFVHFRVVKEGANENNATLTLGNKDN